MKQAGKIFLGDAYQVLQTFPDNSIHLIITSPPYWKQRDYGTEGIGNEATQEEYLANLFKVFGECVRVLREDGNIVFNLGDKFVKGGLSLLPYKFALGVLERFNVKLVNHITWVKTNPTPRQYKKRLVPSTEPFFHFVKSDNYYFDLDSFMAEKSSERKEKEIIKEKQNRKERVGKRYFELIEKSQLSEQEKVLAREELMKAMQEVKDGIIKEFRMKIRGIHAEPFGGQEGGRMSHLRKKGFTIIKIKGNPIKRDVIESPVETIKGRWHPAVYPKKIVAELIKLLSKEGDIVLDPFAGSGTTLVVANELNRQYIGIEINPVYYEEIKRRLESK